MGLFSRIVKNIGRIAEDVAPLIPIVVGGGIAGGIASLALRGVLGRDPASAGGSSAVVRQNQLRPACPPTGFVGSKSAAANPITRAAISPGFDISRLPARPIFGAIQTALAQQPQFQFPQTTSFAVQGFGQPVGPSFRPFTPSFRSGQLGVGGRFVPGISAGLAPAPQFQRFAGRFGGFGGFGGFGFGGF